MRDRPITAEVLAAKEAERGDTHDARRVLLVEDDPRIVRVFKRVLKKGNHQIDSAGTYKEAWEHCQANPPDLLIIDKNLPDGDGVALMKQLRETGSDAAFMMISGNPTAESVVQAMQLGATDYLSKPIVDLDDFRNRVRRALLALYVNRRNRAAFEDLSKENIKLEEMAVRDPLTRLFNHAYLQESIEREVERSRRNGLELSLIFIDFDHFKDINDTLGHQAGDKLLKAFADVLRGASRLYDMSFRLRAQDIAARYGGDEFAVILPETPKQGAAVKAERLRHVVEHMPYADMGLPPVTTSVGLSCYPGDAMDRHSLVEAADQALYAAKALGRNRLVGYSPELTGGQSPEQVKTHARRIEALDRSINTAAFSHLYQPIVKLQSEAVLGYEAFCRPDDSLFDNPLDLILAAERTGRIRDLGRVMRKHSAEVLEKLSKDALLFVNLHSQELYDPNLLAGEAHLLPWAERIVFEVDDTASSRNLDRLLTNVKRVRDLGFKVAVAHVGVEYASLHGLALIKPDFLKIQKTFVVNVEDDTTSARLLRHFMEFAGDEEIDVIAETIESPEEKKLAAKAGIRYGQGYLFGQPEMIGS